MKQQIKIYTDGGCDRNPGGTGGWAYLITNGDRTVENSGRVENTTNNRMELTAAIQALHALTRPTELELLTDSQYLSRGITEWIGNWVRQGWHLKDGSPVKNTDLWQDLAAQARKHRITWTWVKGHADDPYNLHVDQLVQAAIKGKKGKASVPKESSDLVPKVELVMKQHKPVAISIRMAAPGESKSSSAKKIQVDLKHIQKLIEDLLEAQRQAEENR